MPIAMAVGYIGGVALSYFCGRAIVFRVGARTAFRDLKSSLIGIMGVAGGLIALLPALFLATVVGGNLGGAYGEVIFSSLGFGMAGVPLGLALGLCLVTTVVTSAGVLLGAAIGKLLNALISKPAT